MNSQDQEVLLKNLKALAKENNLDISAEIAKIEQKMETSARAVDKVWEKVSIARNPERPRTLDYIEMIFDGDDPAMIGGIGFLNGMPVTVIGNMKGRNLKETIERNGGMANPEGYRKALRLAKQAEKFHRPIISFIDTSGAFSGQGAEERGVGEAIAMNLREFSRLKTPIICVIIGEGGSGGALGIGVGDKIYMLENTIYSVISPEGCASILLRDSSRAKDAAAMLKITSQDVLDLKVINGVIPEVPGGAHLDPQAAALAIKKQISADLEDLTKRNPAVLVKYRVKKIRSMGSFYSN